MSRKEVNDIPLAYIIRQMPRDTTITICRDIEILYGAPLKGATLDNDNIEVYCIINHLAFEQNANNWIERGSKTRRNGRQSMLDLCQHNDGGDEKHKRLQTSRAEMRFLTYKNEHIMTFQLYSSKLKKCFDVIEKCDPPGVSNIT